MLEKIQIHPAIYPANGEIEFPGKCIRPPLLRQVRSQFRNAERGEKRDNPGNHDRDYHRRPGNSCYNSGNYENTGTDDRPDAESSCTK